MTTLPAPKVKYPLWMKNQSQTVTAASAKESGVSEKMIEISPADRWETVVSRRPLPTSVESILTSALDGDLSDQQKLFNNMVDQWPKLSNNLRTLKQGASMAPFVVTPWTDNGKTNKEAERRKQLVEQALWGMRPKEGEMECGAEGMFEFLAEGTVYGHSVLEILWEDRRLGDGTMAVMPRAVQQVDPMHFGYPPSESVTMRDRLMLKKSDSYVDFYDFPDHKFVVQVDRAHRDHPSVSSRMRALTKYWLGGLYGWEWLLVYAQLFGSPFRWANYDSTNPQAKSAVCSMLANMGNSGWGAFPEGTELKFIEASKSGGELPQTLVLEVAEIACDLLILGHTQQTKQNAGSRATEVARNDVRRETLKAVCNRVAQTLTNQFARAVCFVNFGSYDYCPEIRCEIPDAEVTLDEVNAYKTLQDMGMAFDAEYLHNRYAIPVPTNGAQILTPLQKQAPANNAQAKSVSASDADDFKQTVGLQEIYEIVMQSAYASAKAQLGNE